MKCKKCKTLTSPSEIVVHQRETHGVPFSYFKERYGDNIDWEWVEVLYQKHKETGSKGKFQNKFKT